MISPQYIAGLVSWGAIGARTRSAFDQAIGQRESGVAKVIAALRDKGAMDYTVVIVTHSMQQAARISDITAFFHLGEIVEVGTTNQIFTKPREKRTEDYITGRFG